MLLSQGVRCTFVLVVTSCGFYVHGAIDGYSRRILWLRVFVTNKDPWLVGKFSMEYIKESGGRHTLFQ